MAKGRTGRRGWFEFALSPSLRVQRSNPCRHKESMDCFVARAPRNDEETAEATHSLPAAATKSYRCSGRGKNPPRHFETIEAIHPPPRKKKVVASSPQPLPKT